MIIDLQRRLAEIGRIRIGQQVTSANGKTRPTKLETFRLTSPDRNRINQAAQLYGGTVNKWTAPAGPQWEVITTTDTLPVIVPPSDMAFTQHYELWAAGGCQRRCDGITETITDADCLCDPQRRECDIHTRLSVMLRDLPGLGVWRIDTQGYYAAVELQGAVEIVQLAAGRGHMLPATLRLEQRMTKRPNQGTRRFAVPVLDIEVSPGQLLSGTTTIEPASELTEDPPPAALTPVPAAATNGRPSISEQVAAAATITRKRRGGASLPATGILPRTVEQITTLEPAAPEPELLPVHSDAAPHTTPEEEGGERPTPILSDVGQPPPDPDPPATTPQNRRMHAIFRQLGLTDRNDRLTVTSHILGYDLTTSAGLTRNEAQRLLDQLESWQIHDAEYPVQDRIREVLNTAALAEAAEDEQDEPEP
jgi:hypothetical protein